MRNSPSGAGTLPLLCCKSRRDVRAFVYDANVFAWRTGRGGLFGDPFGIGDDSRRGPVSRLRQGALADEITNPARNHEWNRKRFARPPKREPRGSHVMCLISMD